MENKFEYEKKEFDIQITDTKIKPKGSLKFYGVPKDAYKIYIVKDEHNFLYIGITKMYLSSRFTLGFNATIEVGNNGYHGYKWINECREKTLKLIVISFPNMTAADDRNYVETIEAELVYQVRKEFGRWCEYQNEIHFYNKGDEIIRLSEKIFSEIHKKEVANA